MSKAYVYEVVPNSKDGIHSVSPAWVLTFVRWENRYLKESKSKSSEMLSTRKPLVVENDCASVDVSYNKGTHTPSMTALLYAGDINYLTAIDPGDFVFVNMVNFETKAREIALTARGAGKSELNTETERQISAINKVNDGFKGLFKIQSVRRVLAVDPGSGIKRVMFQITGFGFTEFNNTLYFNPNLLSTQETAGDKQFAIFVSRINAVWAQYVTDKGTLLTQNIIKLLINSTIGTGFNDEALNKKEFNVTENTHFHIPKDVGALLGIKKAKAAKDIYTYMFGIQQYQSAGSLSLSKGFNPMLKSEKPDEGRFFQTKLPCNGWSLLKPDYWNQVTVWSVLKQYEASPVNELFTTLRVSPDGLVMPTVVYRQIPFSTNKYQYDSTKFLNLPRWRIDPNLLFNINLGRDEAARVNFVQVYGTMQQATPNATNSFISQQIAEGNFEKDELDIQRSGLKPYIVTIPFDTLLSKPNGKEELFTPKWTKLLGDALIGGHLKLNGSIETAGIEEPIAVGDNLELDGVVYHIEGVNHSCRLNPDGKRSFRTTIQLSHGIDLRTDSVKEFAQMENTDMQLEQNMDYKFYGKTLPGISDEQAIFSRNRGEEGKNTTQNKPFKSNPPDQPSARKAQQPANKKGKQK